MSDKKGASLYSENQHWIVNDGDYQTQIFYTDDPPDPDAENPTEWALFCRKDGRQLASGWGETPRRAREQASVALVAARKGEGGTDAAT